MRHGGRAFRTLVTNLEAVLKISCVYRTHYALRRRAVARGRACGGRGVYEVCAFSSLLYVIFALIYRHIVLCVSHQSTVILIALL